MKISKSSPDLCTKLARYTLIWTLTTHMYATRACLILLQCYNLTPPIFCVHLIKPFHYHSSLPLQCWRILWSKLSTLPRRAALPFTSLAAAVPKSGNSKVYLIDRNNRRGETLHDLTCLATVYRRMKTADVSIMPVQRFLKFWSVSSDRIFGITSAGGPVTLFRSTKIRSLFHFWQAGSSMPFFSLLL